MGHRTRIAHAHTCEILYRSITAIPSDGCSIFFLFSLDTLEYPHNWKIWLLATKAPRRFSPRTMAAQERGGETATSGLHGEAAPALHSPRRASGGAARVMCTLDMTRSSPYCLPPPSQRNRKPGSIIPTGPCLMRSQIHGLRSATTGARSLRMSTLSLAIACIPRPRAATDSAPANSLALS